jgi:hypothetical protein
LPRRRCVFPTSKVLPRQRPNFRQRYEQIEARRAALMQRLNALGGPARNHPSYKRILKLLNETFRKASLAQRAAVLQAADWLIEVLDITCM